MTVVIIEIFKINRLLKYPDIINTFFKSNIGPNIIKPNTPTHRNNCRKASGDKSIRRRTYGHEKCNKHHDNNSCYWVRGNA